MNPKMTELAFWEPGPLGVHFGKVKGSPEERERPMEVAALEAGGYAEGLGGVHPGDVLIAVDGVPVLDTTSIAELQASVGAAGRPLVLSFRTPLPRGTAPPLLSRHAEALRAEGRLIGAAAGYSMALAAGHAAPGWCLNQHGTCLGTAGLLEDALLSFDKAIEVEPGAKSAPRRYNRAYLLRRLGRFEEAVEGFSDAMELDPEHEAPRCSRAISAIERDRQQQPEEVADAVVVGGEAGTVSTYGCGVCRQAEGAVYLCSCDPLQAQWRTVGSHGAVVVAASEVRNAEGAIDNDSV